MLNRLTIGTKIAGAFGLILLVVLALGLTAMNRLSAVNDRAADIRDNWLPSVAAIGALTEEVQNVRLSEARFVLAANDEQRQIEASAFNVGEAKVVSLRAAYEPLIARGTDDEKYTGQFDTLWAQHRQMTDPVLAGHGAEAKALFDPAAMAVVANMMDILSKNVAFNAASGKQAGTESAEIYTVTRQIIMAVLAMSVLLCLAMAYIVITNVSVPLRRMTATMGRLADHDLTIAIDDGHRKDEIGAMAGALQVFKTNMIESDRHQAEQALETEAKVQRAARLDTLTRNFETDAGALVGQISSASTELEATSQSMANNASQTDQQASSAGRAAQEASAGVQTVAAAAEQLTASIGEITRQVAQSAKVSQSAVQDARRTDTIVRALADGANKIGQVVELITSIAGQTNLLALNATIEAARAGDAGQGLRGRRFRGQGTRQPDRQGDRGNRPPYRRYSGQHDRSRERHQRYRQHDRTGQRHCHHHRRRRRTTRRRHRRNRPQRAAHRRSHPDRHGKHHQRHANGRRNRCRLRPGAASRR